MQTTNNKKDYSRTQPTDDDATNNHQQQGRHYNQPSFHLVRSRADSVTNTALLLHVNCSPCILVFKMPPSDAVMPSSIERRRVADEQTSYRRRTRSAIWSLFIRPLCDAPLMLISTWKLPSASTFEKNDVDLSDRRPSNQSYRRSVKSASGQYRLKNNLKKNPIISAKCMKSVLQLILVTSFNNTNNRNNSIVHTWLLTANFYEINFCHISIHIHNSHSYSYFNHISI